MKTRALILLSIASLIPAEALAEDEVRFGRLFTEPKTRNQLNESRKQNSSEQLPATEELEEEAAATVIKMDGVIMRRDGSTEVWINGVRSDSPQLTVRRSAGNRFQVALPGGGEVTLKPGQVYSFESRRVLEGYEAAKELAAEKQNESPTAEEEAAPAGTAEATKQGDEFDESELAEEDFRIKLEQEKGSGN